MFDAIRCDLFLPRERREIPFSCALTLSPLFFLSLASGKDIFDHYDFTRAPKGTKDAPCVVTSEMEYRVVGVTDPDDDSIVIWGRLEEGKGPMLIGDEWFVHKRVGGGGAH